MDFKTTTYSHFQPDTLLPPEPTRIIPLKKTPKKDMGLWLMCTGTTVLGLALLYQLLRKTKSLS